MPTLNSLPIQSAEIEIPYRGTWTAIVKLTDAAAPTSGERVTFAMGSLALSGTVIASDAFGGIAELRIVGGAGGWRKQATDLAFQNDAILTSSDVAQALADSVGETVVGSPQSIGVHWSFDPQVSAGNNLDAISTWYVREDGVTILGERADGAEVRATVESLSGARGRAVCVIEEAEAASFLPGALVSSAALSSSIRVKHARFLVSPNRLAVEVSRNEQLPTRLTDTAANNKRYLGTYVYRIIEQIGDRLELQIVEPTKGLPSQVLIDKAHGIPGVLSNVSPSGLVLLVFGDGDRSRPFATAYIGGAETVTMTANTITMMNASSVLSPVPVALAPALNDTLIALQAACAAVAATPTLPGIVAAFATLNGALAAITRTGSIVVEAQ